MDFSWEPQKTIQKWNKHLYFKNAKDQNHPKSEHCYSLTPPLPISLPPQWHYAKPPFHLACWALGASMTMPTNSSRSRCWGNETHGFFPEKFCETMGELWSVSGGWLSHWNQGCPLTVAQLWPSLLESTKKWPSHKESSFQTHFFRGQLLILLMFSLFGLVFLQTKRSAHEISCRITLFILSGDRKHC